MGPRGAEQLQRVLRGQVGPGLRVLARRGVGRQRVEAVGLHPLGVELALARGGGEVALGEGGVPLGEVQADRPFGPEAVERDPPHGRPVAERLADQGLVVGEELGLEAEAIGQGAEDVVVRTGTRPEGRSRGG